MAKYICPMKVRTLLVFLCLSYVNTTLYSLSCSTVSGFMKYIVKSVNPVLRPPVLVSAHLWGEGLIRERTLMEKGPIREGRVI